MTLPCHGRDRGFKSRISRRSRFLLWLVCPGPLLSKGRGGFRGWFPLSGLSMVCSSVVERLTVNEVVAGSNPAGPVGKISSLPLGYG